MLASAFDDLLDDGASSGLTVALGNYPQLFQTALGDRVLRLPKMAPAILMIYGPVEARLTQSKRVTQAGQVQGV